MERVSSPEQRLLRDSSHAKGFAASGVDVPLGIPLTLFVL